MLKSKRIINHTFNEFCIARKYSNQNQPKETAAFKLQRALIVSKVSRYEFEELRFPNLDKSQLKDKLISRGTDYETMIAQHNVHKEFEKKLAKCFQDVGCEVKLTNRVEFCKSHNKDIVNWADIVVPVGGDGTFLLSAGRASPVFANMQQKTPIVGFNSSPITSEGRLMLPKHFSECPQDAVAKIKSGNFHWMHRSRIRTTLLGNSEKVSECKDLHSHGRLKNGKGRTPVCMTVSKEFAKKYEAKMMAVLPYLALNEVFIGETLSARVSHLKLVIDQSCVVNKTKCSGLCVTTGSGSTSWHTSINRLTKQEVEGILQILTNRNVPLGNINIQEIVDKYNQNLLFLPDDPRMCYSIREQICGRVWPYPNEFSTRDFVKNLYIRSKCVDASLVIDGSISYPFNDGAKALLEVHPEDALLTIALD